MIKDRTFSKRSRTALEGVHPDLVRLMTEALQRTSLDFVVIEGLRTPERQRELVAKGASKTLRSRHLTGHAVDLLPIGPNGPRFDWPLYDRLGPEIKAIAQELSIPIVWGGDWKSFRDGPHFELDRNAYPVDDSAPLPKAPKEPTLAGSRTMKGAATAGLGPVAEAAINAAKELEPVAQSNLVPYLQYLPPLLLTLGLLIVVYARWDDWRSGARR